MATLILRSLTCHRQEDFTFDDDVQILVDGSATWRNNMDTGQTRNLGIELEFADSVRVQLLELDVEGNDSLGSVTINEENAGSDRVATFTDDEADYSLSYRVNAADEDDDEWWSDSGDDESDVSEDPAEPDPEDTGPSGDGDTDGSSEPCPLGHLAVQVVEDDDTPVEGAQVTMVEAGVTQVTDAEGRTTFGPLEEGVYTVEASKEDYIPDPATETAHVVGDSTSQAELTLNPDAPAVTIEAGDVACPGHLHQARASGNPAGGTYAWTIQSGSGTAQLIDGSGAAATTGDTLFLRGIEPEEVTLEVTYTESGRTATATKTITIHSINYRVRNFTVARGGFQANENAAGVQMWNIPPNPAFSLDPTVRIQVDASCPRKADCAQNHRVGWLQVMRVDNREVQYPSTRFWVDCPMPIRDAWRDTVQPFYDGPSVQTFAGDGDTQTAHQEDSPSFPGAPGAWTDPRPGAVGDLNMQSITLEDRFIAWLVVQNIEWARDVAVSSSFTYLKHIAWRCALTSNIDHTQAVGSRASPRRQITAFADGEGKGSGNPIFTAPVFNNTANLRRNP
jgi:hypothetical protein